MRRAVALHRAGQVEHLVLTGAGIGGDSALAMKEVAVRMGVSEAAIVVETESRTTRENLAFAAPLLRARGLATVALVTSDSHLGRAERVARRVAPDVVWLPVPVPDAGPASRVCGQRLAEWVKLAGYLVRGWA